MEIIRIEGLSKHFSGVRALEDVSFSINEGSIHGLIGPNGSGKTTTFNVISGVFPATAGEIFFKDNKITSMKSHDIARLGIGRTFQKPWVMPKLSCLENVMTGMYSKTKSDVLGTFLRRPFSESKQEKMIKDKASELLSFVGLEKSMNRWAGELVWAELHLMQIARALMSDPAFLMLDEPASGMGEAERETMKDIIRQVNKTGVTVLIIAHEVKLVTEVSETITAIEFGKKICDGTPSEVTRHPKVIEAYLGTE